MPVTTGGDKPQLLEQLLLFTIGSAERRGSGIVIRHPVLRLRDFDGRTAKPAFRQHDLCQIIMRSGIKTGGGLDEQQADQPKRKTTPYDLST